MKSVGAHLGKYITLGAESRSARAVCAQVISRVVRVEVSEKNVVLKNEVLYCRVAAPLKIKIHESKREILAELRKVYGLHTKQAVCDIV